MHTSKQTFQRLITAAGCGALLFATLSAQANYLAEDFAYSGGSGFASLNGGLDWNGAWQQDTTHATVSGSSLAYSTGGYSITQTNGAHSAYFNLASPYRGVMRYPVTNPTNSVWFSTLMICSNSTSAVYLGFDGLNTNGSSGSSLFDYLPSTTYSIGISNSTLVVGENGNSSATWSPFTYTTNNALTQGNVHLVIGCITFQSYGNLDSVQVWADPPDLTHLGAPQFQESAYDIGNNLYNVFVGGQSFGALAALRFSDGNGNEAQAYTDVTGATDLNAFPATLAPTVVLAEDFDYAAGNFGATAYNGGTGWSGAWSGTTGNALVSAANSLAYTAGHYSITQSNVSGSFYGGTTSYRGGVRYPAFGPAGNVWFSTLMLASNSTSQAYIGFNSVNTNISGSTAMNYMPSTTYSIGISNATLVVAYGANSSGTWSSFTTTTNNNLTQGVPHLILGDITFSSGNSTISIWADPADLTHLGLPQWSETAHNIGTNLLDVSLGGLNFGALDAIRISGNASAYTDVTGTTNLSVPTPTVTISPAPGITGNGSNFVFTTTTTGSGLAYQWAFNGAVLAYDTGSTLTVTNASSASRGLYAVTVTNLGGSAIASTTLEVTNCNLNLVWEGGAAYVGPAIWDVASTNWGLVSAPATREFYGDGDTVTFDDTSTNKTMTVQGMLNPNKVILNSTNGSPSGQYSFNGGTIGGTGQLIDNGTANVSFYNACAYTGGTVTEPSSAGPGYLRFLPGGLAGNVVLNGAGLAFQGGNGTFAGNVTGTNVNSLIAAASQLGGFSATLSGNLSHAGGISVNAGTVVLTGSNSYAGDTTVGNLGFAANSPILRIGSVMALPYGTGKGNMIVNGNPAGQAGLLDLNGFNAAINALGGTATNAVNGVVSNGVGSVTLTLGNDDADGNYPCDIIGGINITKVGLGKQRITGGNLAYTGNTTISNGTLALSGTLSGQLTVDATATLAIGPANSLATLSANNIALGGTLSLKIDKDFGLQNDVLSDSSGTLNLAGTLDVDNISTNSTLAVSDSFTLFSGGLASNFTNVILPSLPVGLVWDTSNLPVTGTIVVTTASYASNPTNITVSVTGSTLNLSWPADHLGWLLQDTTNLTTPNWVTVPGSASVNLTNIIMNPGIPAVFFRLSYP